MATNPLSEFMSGVKKLWFVSTGAAAHDAAASGNPVQVGGVYRATDPAVADGDVASLRVNAKGEAIVSLSGRNVALIPVLNAIEVRGTSNKFIDISDLDKYKDIDFAINNTHDIACNIGFQSSGGMGEIRIKKSDGTLCPYYYTSGGIFHVIPANTAGFVYLSAYPVTTAASTDQLLYKKLLHSTTRMYYRFSEGIPTTGSLSIWLQGIIN